MEISDGRPRPDHGPRNHAIAQSVSDGYVPPERGCKAMRHRRRRGDRLDSVGGAVQLHRRHRGRRGRRRGHAAGVDRDLPARAGDGDAGGRDQYDEHIAQ